MLTTPLNVTRIWLTLCRLPNTSVTELRVTSGGSTGMVSETVSNEEPVTPWNEATIDDWPGAIGVTNPVALMMATPGTDDDHDTWFVRSTVVLSERIPVANELRRGTDRDRGVGWCDADGDQGRGGVDNNRRCRSDQIGGGREHAPGIEEPGRSQRRRVEWLERRIGRDSSDRVADLVAEQAVGQGRARRPGRADRRELDRIERRGGGRVPHR